MGMLGALGTAVGTWFGGPVGGSIGGALGGAVDGRNAELSANRTNKQSIELANTAYQRSMADMKKAGLNPILAGKLGGASVPGLNVPGMFGVQAANQSASTAFQGAQTASNVNLQSAQTRVAEVNAQLTETQNILSKNLIPGSKAIAEVTQQVANLAEAVTGIIGQSSEGYTKLMGEASTGLVKLLEKAEKLGGNAKSVINEVIEDVKNSDTSNYLQNLYKQWQDYRAKHPLKPIYR